jgi:hypothetical protein
MSPTESTPSSDPSDEEITTRLDEVYRQTALTTDDRAWTLISAAGFLRRIEWTA